jgi:hypothetical protein
MKPYERRRQADKKVSPVSLQDKGAFVQAPKSSDSCTDELLSFHGQCQAVGIVKGHALKDVVEWPVMIQIGKIEALVPLFLVEIHIPDPSAKHL